MNKFNLLFITVLLVIGCNTKTQKMPVSKNNIVTEDANSSKIKVFNFGTFHMAGTSDAHKTEFDENDVKSKSETYEIAKMIAKFKPTVICVEREPSENENMNKDYQLFLNNDKHLPNYPGEIGLIAYQVGKLTNVKKIYCIDEQETAQYNYNITNELENPIDSITSKMYLKHTFANLAETDKLSTLEKLRSFNTQEFYDLSINLNADILSYTATKNHFEGADEAAKFYRRNLRIYSNLNQIPLSKNDRVFIIMGTAHAAFLNEFLKRSPKYETVNVLDYLK
ncbi:DUF5694 domain-containing protein [Flavobacterium arcticum]|nr:DUF5694 domain-containing protein [Flavobacterium arcticum]